MFIGFGGNIVREKVKAGAPWFIYDIQDLITELQKPHPQAPPLQVSGEVCKAAKSDANNQPALVDEVRN